MTQEQIRAEVERLSAQRSLDQQRPERAFTRQEFSDSLGQVAASSRPLTRALREGTIVFVGKFPIPDVTGRTQQIPMYRFVDKPESEETKPKKK